MSEPGVGPSDGTADAPRAPHRGTLLVLFFLSGACGLVYQVVWLRQLILVFGATAFASSAILATFMGGLAIGASWAGRRADRWTASPLRAYGRLELAVAVCAALVPLGLAAMTPILRLAWRLGAEHHFVLFGLVKLVTISVLILPATTLMGATLPVLARSAARGDRGVAGRVGGLYAANTFGAVSGTLASAYGLLPAIGSTRTLLTAVAVNLAVGGAAWWMGGRQASDRPAGPAPVFAAPDSPALRTLLLVFGASGCAAMVLETVWTRGLALVLGSSVYAYAAMLTAFLLGLAAGAASAARWLSRGTGRSAVRALAWVLVSAGVLSLGAAYALQLLPRAFVETYFRLSPSPEGWFVVELVLSLALMFPTTFALGWIFPLVLDAAGARRSTVASSVGRVYAANTVGTIVGAVAGGFVLLPLAGVNATLVGVAAAQAALGGVVALRAVRSPGGAAAATAVAVALVVLRPSWDARLMNSGPSSNVTDTDRSKGWAGFVEDVHEDNEIVFAREGLTASVFVGREREVDNLYLAVNGKTDASSRLDLETQVLLGQLPLLLHPHPKDVLVVGLASGITAGSVATHPIEHLRIVEVEKLMIDAARCFAEFNGDVLSDPRVEVSINDARNELVFGDARYDVIVSEPSNPWMTVASNLFTDDFFRIVRGRLRPGGVFEQWIQTYCLPPDSVRSILRGIRASFPHVMVFEASKGVDLLVVASEAPLTLDAAALEGRMSELQVRLDLGRIRVRSAVDLLALLQCSGSAVDAIVRDARRNTDETGLVEFSAPKSLFIASQDANLAMLQSQESDPLDPFRAAVVGVPLGDDFRWEIARRWAFRDAAARARKLAEFAEDPAVRDRILGLVH